MKIALERKAWNNFNNQGFFIAIVPALEKQNGPKSIIQLLIFDDWHRPVCIHQQGSLTVTECNVGWPDLAQYCLQQV